MFHRVKILDIELNDPPIDIEGLEEYTALKVLVRLHGIPLGYTQLPVVNGHCKATVLRKTILEQHKWAIIRHQLCNFLASRTKPDEWTVTYLLDALPPDNAQCLPPVTVAVCTRGRADDLALCLASLRQLEYPNLDIVIVDNAPPDDATERLVKEDYPDMRYVCEPRPGLDWARNRAIVEAKGEIIAFTDDDVVVDPGWVKALAKIFAENPEVMAVTGLVVPYELETESQMLFELCGGFGRGFTRKWHRLSYYKANQRWKCHGTGQFGTGANMAYRLSVFEDIGYFDPALDVGTVTNGGGDLEMFFRVLKAGHILVYEPSALVRHRHRREYAQLWTQLNNNSTGLLSSWVCTAIAYPDERKSLLRMAFWWLKHGYLQRLTEASFGPSRIPRDLILGELKGYFTGLTRYQKAQKNAAQIAEKFGSTSQSTGLVKRISRPIKPDLPHTFAVRSVDLAQPLTALTDVTNYRKVRIFVMKNDQPLGSVDIVNHGQPISVTRLYETIVDRFGLMLLVQDQQISEDIIWAELISTLKQRYLPSEKEKKEVNAVRLPDDIPVSIVVATLDRPDDLRECLKYLLAQETSRPVEIVVVDNNPASGLTPPVVDEFPGVVLVNESRRGLAYARNAGFTASTGHIAVATDDDVRVPPGWLEKLVAPFARNDVMIVTGNVLPLELDTEAQIQFERYGGLGRGFKPFEVGNEWFHAFRRGAVSTWSLGATANAAFRASIFTHPQIGLMDEALGPGMPSGVGEDTYLFYKALKAGYTLVYEPSAYVWHKHRREPAALRRQLFSYSKGHVAYHLTTLIRDRDLRTLMHLFVHLPKYHLSHLTWHMKGWLKRKKGNYPLSLTILEIYGNLIGPMALWQSYRRVNREGHSKPYPLVSQRLTRKGKQSIAEPAQSEIEVSDETAAYIS